MTTLVVLTIVDVVLLVAGLAFYLYWVGTLLTRIAGNLEEGAEIVATIVGHARLIGPGVEHINQTGGVGAGAPPLLERVAEGILTDLTPRTGHPAPPKPPPPHARPPRAETQHPPCAPYPPWNHGPLEHPVPRHPPRTVPSPGPATAPSAGVMGPPA